MAYLIEGGDSAFDAMVYGEHHQGTIAFLDEQRNKTRNYLTASAQEFKQRANTVIERFNESTAMRLTRAVARKMANSWNMDTIMPLTTIGQLQHSKPTMQKYIMAEPTVRKAYHDQRCDGFSDSYVDLQPKVVGNEHYEYRRATNAVFFGGGEKPMESVTYYEKLKDDDRNLTTEEKADVMLTWRTAKELLLTGKEDPTSVYNALL